MSPLSQGQTTDGGKSRAKVNSSSMTRPHDLAFNSIGRLINSQATCHSD